MQSHTAASGAHDVANLTSQSAEPRSVITPSTKSLAPHVAKLELFQVSVLVDDFGMAA